MLRRILSVLIGIIVAIVICMGVENLTNSLYPAPKGLNTLDHHALAMHIAHLPLRAFVVLMMGWIVGSFICGFIIRIISKTSAKTPAYIAGLFLTTAGLTYLLVLPHPIWFIIMGTAVFIPFTLLGHVVVPRQVAD